MDTADELASAILRSIRDASPRDGSGTLRADGPAIVQALLMATGAVIASAPAHAQEGVIRQFASGLPDQVKRLEGAATGLKGDEARAYWA